MCRTCTLQGGFPLIPSSGVRRRWKHDLSTLLVLLIFLSVVGSEGTLWGYLFIVFSENVYIHTRSHWHLALDFHQHSRDPSASPVRTRGADGCGPNTRDDCVAPGQGWVLLSSGIVLAFSLKEYIKRRTHWHLALVYDQHSRGLSVPGVRTGADDLLVLLIFLMVGSEEIL